ncbi:DUF3299 domain-containing protein [Flammeovirga sp. SubArs3]|uniref:DUF3299 domain-containing protein n=1 Tax=Flammeovirga sp. SubArs3 TaxID=2995316 RepID=UPI00248BDC26|nr:DUF3299 domain-containing protein [Flammeovirga sp. SubArs3]
MKKALFILITAFLSFNLSAQDYQELDWDNLLPENISFDDPFKDLSRSQLLDLKEIAYLINKKKASPEDFPEEHQEKLQQKEQSLKEQGIDAHFLLSKREEIKEKRQQFAEAVVEDLNHEQVKIPGYLLPLNFSGLEVTEFLLVPWVGACIHTPPPNKNQIIYIKFDKGYEVTSRFESVWITGEMTTQSVSKELYLVDGKSEIFTGYSIHANQILSYVK